MSPRPGPVPKGVLLAGGTGRRLAPRTDRTNKHLLPVGDRPMVQWPLRTLVDAGCTRVLAVTGGEFADSVRGGILAPGGPAADGTVQVDFVHQDRPGGIAHALALAESFADGDPVVVMLGDNIVERSVRPHLEAWAGQAGGNGALVCTCELPPAEATRFGVVRFDDDGAPAEILEKPAEPPSGHVVTGVYAYDAEVFDIIAGLEPSARGELEISDVNNAYLAGGRLMVRTLAGWWTDAGTPETLERADRLVREHLDAGRVPPLA